MISATKKSIYSVIWANMIHLRAQVTFCLLFISLSGFTIDFSKINSAWQYDDQFELQLVSRVIDSEEGILVYLEINSDSLWRWEPSFFLQDGYDAKEERQVAPEVDTLKFDFGQPIITLVPPILEDEDLLIIQFVKGEEVIYYDIILKNKSLRFPKILPKDLEGRPILTTYINSDNIRWTGSEYYFTMQYRESEELPDAPMGENKMLAPKAELDSIFTFIDSAKMETGFFYSVLPDSNASTALTVLRVPPYFPEYRQLDELIESMLYITNEPERKSLTSSKNPKRTFDSFWLNTFYTKRRARGAIRTYYDRVKHANRLFTTNMPGWKTDRGMIRVVFGKPSEVYRSDNSEVWYYPDNQSFQFTVISTFFAARTYKLRRDIKYENSWYDQLASLRSYIYE